METLEALNLFYSVYDEDSRLCSRHGSVEYLTTMRYVELYLHPGMRILEIGAGTGRYSHALARQGYNVDAVELVQHNIDIFRKNTQPGERVRIFQGNAMNLDFAVDDIYDITLLLGPMYHLYREDEQKRSLAEAIRVTKPGGIVFSAYCGNDASMIQFCFGQGKMKEKRYQDLTDPATFKAASNPEEVFQLYRKEEIDALMADFPVSRLHYVGTDMATHYMRTCVDEMDDELFEWYLRYHFAICERMDMVGISNHILDIFRKEG